MMRAYLATGDGTVECGLSVARIRKALADERSVLWVDIEDPEDADIELLLEVFELHPLTVEDCIMPNARPKLEEFDHYLFVILQGVRREPEGHLRTAELDLCLGKNFLVTVRTGRLKSIEENCIRVEKKSPVIGRGADFLLYTITESLIDSYFPILDEVETKVDELQAKILAGPSGDPLRDLFHVYNELVTLRRTLAPHREILSRLYREEFRVIKQAHAIYFRDIYDHLTRMSELVDSGREVMTMLLEAHATIVSNRLNEIMKTMTAGATLALPLVIVTGIFGMNFGEHPELGPRWIYQVASLTLLLAIPVLLVLFRRYRWL